MKPQHKRALLILLAFAALLALASGIWFRRQVRSHRLDHSLIAAIKKRDVRTVTMLLDQGADANATDNPDEPVTLRDIVQKYWDKLRSGERSPQTRQCPPALMRVYHYVYHDVPGTIHDAGGHEGSGGNFDFELDDPKRLDPEPMISALLDHGAELGPASRLGSELLRDACICGDAKTVRVLLKHHVDPNTQADSTYASAFAPLLYTENCECARLLLEAGANPNSRAWSGVTRLMCTRDPKLITLLLEHGANPNATDNDGQTPLIHSTVQAFGMLFQERPDVEILFEYGGRAATRDKKGHTVLDYARDQWVDWLDDPDRKRWLSNYKHNIRLLEEALKREKSAGRAGR